MSNETLIRTEKLKKHFPTPAGLLHAVDSIDLDIKKGTTLGVGESGCGKSTLGRLILRLIEPTGGKIFFDGEDIMQFKGAEMARFRQQAAIVFQDPYASLNPRMTVSEIIEEPLIVNHYAKGSADRQKLVFKMMETVGLAARLINAYPHELDGGRRQRIGIARALILNPKFVVCDEPVSALDVSIQAQILNLLMDLQDEFGLTYMFITHDLSVVKHISDEIMVMYRGVCVERAEKHEFFKQPSHPYSIGLLDAIPKPSLEGRGKKREILHGEVSSPINMPPGCRFTDRCKFCTEVCKTDEAVALRSIGRHHEIACPLNVQRL